VKSVVGALREAAEAEVRALSPERRVALALRLGDDDLEIYRDAQGLDRKGALAELRRRRRSGRQPSRCLEDDDA